jgi:hypothetical protein
MKLREDLVELREENDKALGPLRCCLTITVIVAAITATATIFALLLNLNITSALLPLIATAFLRDEVSKAREELSARVAEVILMPTLSTDNILS